MFAVTKNEQALILGSDIETIDVKINYSIFPDETAGLIKTNFYMRRCHHETRPILKLNNPIIKTFSIINNLIQKWPQ